LSNTVGEFAAGSYANRALSVIVPNGPNSDVLREVAPLDARLRAAEGGTDQLWTTFLGPELPTLPAASARVAVNVYVPDVVIDGDTVNVHAPDEQVVVPVAVRAPVIDTVIVEESPATVEQAPPTEVTDDEVVYGNERKDPFTRVRVTFGAVLSIVIVCVPLVPALPAASPWEAVTP
jgi:hypothetical protein